MTKDTIILLTCEHAVNHIPANYQATFSAHHSLLNSHRGIDFGAATIANYLAEKLPAKLFTANTSRLLIDCNRSMNHPNCYSEITRDLPEKTKKAICDQYYLPYRHAIEQWIETQSTQGRRVLHLSIHSFTPELNGQIREVDIGLLFDPKRLLEKQQAQQWKNNLKRLNPPLRICLNKPYQGTSDGFTTALRKKFPATAYLGIEVESNQAMLKNTADCLQIAERLFKSFS